MKDHFFCEEIAAVKERRQKYKRCLAMAELCRTSALYEKSLDASKYCKWRLKWYERWLKIAEQFKRAK